MSKSVPMQHPAVVLRSQYRNLRSLVAVLLVVVAALSATVAVIAIDGDGTTTSTSSVASGRSYPTLDDPFHSRAQPTRPQSRPDESAIASSIAGSRSYPTLSDPFQSQVEQPRPLGGPNESAVAAAISPRTGSAAPDESKIAAALAEHADTGPQARARAWQQKLDSMTPQQEAEAFVEGQ